MKRFRFKNQIMITTLAVLIAVGGYISYKSAARDEDDYVMTSTGKSTASGDAMADVTTQEDMEDAGEAVVVSSEAAKNYAATARMNREQARAKAKEELQAILDNASLSEDAKKEAANAMVRLIANQEAEMEIENLLEAKGFSDVVVTVSNDSVDVVVEVAVLTDAQMAQIEDVVLRKVDIDPTGIVITPFRVN